MVSNNFKRFQMVPRGFKVWSLNGSRRVQMVPALRQTIYVIYVIHRDALQWKFSNDSPPMVVFEWCLQWWVPNTGPFWEAPSPPIRCISKKRVVVADNNLNGEIGKQCKCWWKVMLKSNVKCTLSAQSSVTDCNWIVRVGWTSKSEVYEWSLRIANWILNGCNSYAARMSIQSL